MKYEKRLGELLIKRGFLNEEKLRLALSYQKLTETLLGDALVKLGFISSYEIAKALAEQAKDRLRRLGYNNVTVRNADGFFGWKEHAPFDRIIVTAASTLVPPPLIKQLKPGGKICIPVGGAYAIQYLTMVEKSVDNKIIMKKMLPVRFVPLTRTLR